MTRVLTVSLLASALLCGTVFALMFRQTNVLENQFQTAFVDCVVHEKLDGSGDYTSGLENANSKTEIKVENTSNIDAYIRLRFVTYWQDVNGNIVGKTSQMPEFTINGNWIKGSDNTYYYKKPVASGQFTDDLLASDIVLKMEEDKFIQVVEVFADAIQCQPSRAAVNSWKVTIDGDGNITKAP